MDMLLEHARLSPSSPGKRLAPAAGWLTFEWPHKSYRQRYPGVQSRDRVTHHNLPVSATLCTVYCRLPDWSVDDIMMNDGTQNNALVNQHVIVLNTDISHSAFGLFHIESKILVSSFAQNGPPFATEKYMQLVRIFAVLSWFMTDGFWYMYFCISIIQY